MRLWHLVARRSVEDPSFAFYQWLDPAAAAVMVGPGAWGAAAC